MFPTLACGSCNNICVLHAPPSALPTPNEKKNPPRVRGIREHSQIRSQTRRVQVRIHRVPLDRIPQMRREPLPKPKAQPIELLESRRLPRIDRHRHLQSHRSPKLVRRERGGVPRVILGSEAEVELLHPREQDRRFYEQDERVRLLRRMVCEQAAVVRPLAFARRDQRLQGTGQVFERSSKQENIVELTPFSKSCFRTGSNCEMS